MLPQLNPLKNREYTRKELQTYCMQLGIKANGKNDEMYQLLENWVESQQSETQQQIHQQELVQDLQKSINFDKSQFSDSQTPIIMINSEEIQNISTPNQMILSMTENTPKPVIFDDASSHIKLPGFIQQNELAKIDEEVEDQELAILIQIVNKYRKDALQTLKTQFERKMRQFQRQANIEIMIIPPGTRTKNVDEIQNVRKDSIFSVTQELEKISKK